MVFIMCVRVCVCVCLSVVWGEEECQQTYRQDAKALHTQLSTLQTTVCAVQNARDARRTPFSRDQTARRHFERFERHWR